MKSALKKEKSNSVAKIKNLNSKNFIGNFELNQVYKADCIEALKAMPDNCVDIIIADPPYNASKGNCLEWNSSSQLPGMGGDWSKIMATWDNLPLNEYFLFTVSWLSQAKRVLKDTGSIWIHGTYHNIGIINFVMQMLSLEIINEIVWYKRNSFPNLSGRRLTASHETILWGHTGIKQRNYYFNYDLSKNMDTPSDLLKLPGKQMRTVWDIPNNKAKEELCYGKHPTQKPLRLIDRMIKISGKPGDILLSPFAGSGSECVAAKNLGLDFIGFELEQEFIDICNERLGK